jgi:single-strand DNA-binding protein
LIGFLEGAAMADLNKVFLMGSLTFDPELRRTPSGTAVTELRMATSRSWPGRDGERREEKLFIDVTVWDRQAENCCQFLRKGSSVHVEGFLRLDSWEDKNTGEKRSRLRVTAERVQFLDSRRTEGASSGPDDDYGSSPAPARDTGSRRAAAQNRGTGGYGEPPGPGNGPAGADMHISETLNHRGAEPAGGGEAEDIPF